MELVLVILILSVLVSFLTLIKLTKELDESNSLVTARTIGLNNAETRVKSLSIKVQERDKLIKDYTEALTKICEILDLEILASDKVDKIKELVRPANQN